MSEEQHVEFTPIEEAIERFKRGEYVVVMDDESRENEGDIVMAAQFVTPKDITFALKHTSGILCAPMTTPLAKKFDLSPMVKNPTDPNGTAFTVTVDHIDTSTGVSSRDRSVTFKALADPLAEAQHFTRPGHVFPLVARPGGILERRGHTEATVDLCLLSGLYPVGLLAEIMNEDGTMSRLMDCVEFAKKYELAIITVEHLAAYRASLKDSEGNVKKFDVSQQKNNDSKVELVASCKLPIQRGDQFLGQWDCQLFYSAQDKVTHTVLSKGNIEEKKKNGEPVLIRLHSECFTGNTLGSLRCDCGEQLDLSLKAIHDNGTGLVIYIGGHEGRGIGLINKVRAYNLQDEESLDTYEANVKLGFEKDLRDYSSALEIIKALGLKKLDLMTNNKWKYQALNSYIERITPLTGKETPHNSKYLEAKRKEHGNLSGKKLEERREENSPGPCLFQKKHLSV